MKLYCGIDLHSSNNYFAVIDEGGKKIFKRRLANDMPTILEVAERYGEDIVGIAVESTYNWY